MAKPSLTARAECWRSPQPACNRTRRSGSNLCWRLSASWATPASNNSPFEMNPMTIETSFDSNYRKVLVAARRARQLQSDYHALVASQSTKACRIVQEEIEAGNIAYVKADVAVTKPLVEGPAVPILVSLR